MIGAASLLLATSIGGGGATTPIELRVRESGYILGPLLFLVAGCWTTYASWLLLTVGRATNLNSYEEIALKLLGPIGSIFVKLLIVLNGFFSCVTAQEVFANMLLPHKICRDWMILISVAVALPLTAFMRDAKRLTVFSVVTAGATLVFFCFIAARPRTHDFGVPFGEAADSDANTEEGNATSRREHDGPVPFARHGHTLSIGSDAFSSIVNGFVVQFNLFSIYKVLPQDTAYRSTMFAVLISASVAFGFYVVIDLICYQSFGLKSYEDVIDLYEDMLGGQIALGAFGIGQILSYPVMAYASVTVLSQWCFPLTSAAKKGGEPTERSLLASKTEASMPRAMSTPKLDPQSMVVLLDEQHQLTEELRLLRPDSTDAAVISKIKQRLHEVEEHLEASTQETQVDRTCYPVFANRFYADAAVGTAWVVATSACAIYIKMYEVPEVLDLIGAASAVPLMTIFPPLLRLQCRDMEDELCARCTALHWCMLALGCATVGMCAFMAVEDFEWR